jgi:hypothetical protein
MKHWQDIVSTTVLVGGGGGIIIFSRVNQWLLDSVSDVVQETSCST